MIEAVGHAVSRLIRIRYGAMMLPRGLKRGAWLELDDADIRSLLKAAGGSQHADGLIIKAAQLLLAGLALRLWGAVVELLRGGGVAPQTVRRFAGGGPWAPW
jgi:23S rRNA pseudouridine2605 synthase